MKCFYHSADLDGHCSGAIVKWVYPECEMRPINYGDQFPWDDIEVEELVFMVDFSLQPFHQMLKLNGMCNLIWIDHHISAIEEYQRAEVSIDGSLGVGKAACELVWEYLAPNLQVPRTVQLLGRYDIWDHTDGNTIPFQYGMRQELTRPNTEAGMKLWQSIFTSTQHEDHHNRILSAGRYILKYIKADNRKYCEACAFETELDGLRCIAVNRLLTNSQMFDGVYFHDKHDAMLAFGFRAGRWTISLYTDKDDVDVSVIAKLRGGGGHRQAAGFQADKLPFRLV